MNQYFESKVKYQGIDQNGNAKSFTEQYLVPAISFTDAEAKIIAHVSDYVKGDIDVKSIKKVNTPDVIRNKDGAIWNKVVVSFCAENSDSGESKKIQSILMIEADTVKEAEKEAHEFLKQLMTDYEISSVSKTKIIDVLN